MMTDRPVDTFIRDKIIALHGHAALRRSALNIRGGAGCFEWAMKGRGYRTALEIGTYKGCATAELSRFCDQAVTIDLAHGKLESNREQWDREKFWRDLGVLNITLYTVENDFNKKLLVDVLDFDFAFIDGAHDATVASDFDLVKRCGNVLFHDADDNGPNKANHVHEFIKTLPADEVEFKDIFALWTAKNKS